MDRQAFINHIQAIRRSWQKAFFLERAEWKRVTTVRRALRRRFINEAGELNSDGRRVMNDLAQFCYVRKSTVKISPKTGTIDPYAMGVAEGRRETYLRIAQALNLNDATFNRLLTNTEDMHHDDT